MLIEHIRQLQAGNPLSPEQVRDAVAALTDEQISVETKADFLTALANKGETVEEIAAFAHQLRGLAVQPPIEDALRQEVILDVVGTGGDKLTTFNISTTSALICAAAGVRVAKHGNRAVTSKCGSADVIEALGIRLDLTPEEAVASLREHHFAFFFAPKYHPAFKHIVPARKLCAARGQVTIFNFLGPLLNPVRPTAQLLGVPRPELCEPMAKVLQSLGLRRAIVVCGAAGAARLDEFSTLGENTVAEFYQDRALAVSTFSPAGLPLQPADLADLRGGDQQVNATIIRRLLTGEERGPKRDAVLLNAGAALFVADRVKSITEGWTLAEQLIDTGAAAAKLRALAGQAKTCA